MTLLDTTDGILMCKAYDWALLNPVRRMFYNVTTTGLSAAVALGVGSMELLQAVVRQLRLHGGLYDSIDRFDFGSLGYVVAGFFLLAWGCSAAVWKLTGPGAERIRAD
jgi:high-affinity nickel-transport protein